MHDDDFDDDFESDPPGKYRTSIICAVCEKRTPERYFAFCQMPTPTMCWSCASQNPRTHGDRTCIFCEERHCLACQRFRPEDLRVRYCSVQCREAWEVRRALERPPPPNAAEYEDAAFGIGR